MKNKLLELFSIIDTSLEVVNEILTEIYKEEDSPDIKVSVQRHLRERFEDIQKRLQYVIGEERNRDPLMYLVEQFDARSNKFDSQQFRIYVKETIATIINILETNKTLRDKQSNIRMLELNVNKLAKLLNKKEKFFTASELSNLYALIDSIVDFIKNVRSNAPVNIDNLIIRIDFVLARLK